MLVKNIVNPNDIEEIISSLNIQDDTVLIKPNWVGAFPGGYTDSKIIDLFLSHLKIKKIIFIESYTFWRTDKKKDGGDDYFSSKEATLETGEMHWDFFRKMDDWFFKYTGIGDVLDKYNAKYLCLTNEIWKDNITQSHLIKSVVEEKFIPVADTSLYSLVPLSIFELKGKPLISLAKAKIDSVYGFSGSVKNMFGLIPDPNRFDKYHGQDETKLGQSIIDINKIYQGLFDVKYVVESVYEYSHMDWDKETSHKQEGNGIIIAGDSGVEVDRKAEEIYNSRMKGPLQTLLQSYDATFSK